ncbi:hypothetical protein MHYP_G00013570 [Metynnis hypsauchen]
MESFREGKPKPTVRVEDPQSSVYTGDTVTLSCEVESTGWTFLWYEGSQELQPQSPADKNPNTVRVTVSDAATAEFRCKASRKNYYYSYNYYDYYYKDYDTQFSDPVQIRVTGKPKLTVRVEDPQSSVYTGDTVTLTCEVESTGWTFLWYKGSQLLQPQSPADKENNTVRVTVSDAATAEFKCKTSRKNYYHSRYYYYYTQTSDPVQIRVTARPKATVTIQPADPVFIGETVTLTCDIGSGDGWQYDWFKNNKPLSGAQWRNEYTISKVAESHRGVYTCRGRQSTAPSYSETSAAVTLTVSGE